MALFFRDTERAQLCNFEEETEDVHHLGKEGSNTCLLLPGI